MEEMNETFIMAVGVWCVTLLLCGLIMVANVHTEQGDWPVAVFVAGTLFALIIASTHFFER